MFLDALRTVVWNKQEWRRKYWATRSSLRSFACTAHSFACYGLLASLVPSAALTRSLAHFAHSLARGTANDWMAILSVFFSIFDHSGGREVRLLQRMKKTKDDPGEGGVVRGWGGVGGDGWMVGIVA